MNILTILFLTVALPVLCVTFLISQVIQNKGRKNRVSDDEEQMLNEIYNGMKDLRQRIENLESLMHDR